MRRLFWLGLGVTVGVFATRRMASAARHLTPGGLAEDLADAMREFGVAIGSFGADVRAGMVERERELHEMVEERTGSGSAPNGERTERAAQGARVARASTAADSAVR
jgi:hypothetical protein